MTRFARAKGSKASNERKEEEATPWHVMKQQLMDLHNTSALPDNQNSTSDLKNLLQCDTTLRKEIWSDFGDINGNKVKPISKKKIKGKYNISPPELKEDNKHFKIDGSEKHHIINADDFKNQLKKCRTKSSNSLVPINLPVLTNGFEEKGSTNKCSKTAGIKKKLKDNFVEFTERHNIGKKEIISETAPNLHRPIKKLKPNSEQSYKIEPKVSTTLNAENIKSISKQNITDTHKLKEATNAKHILDDGSQKKRFSNTSGTQNDNLNLSKPILKKDKKNKKTKPNEPINCLVAVEASQSKEDIKDSVNFCDYENQMNPSSKESGRKHLKVNSSNDNLLKNNKIKPTTYNTWKNYNNHHTIIANGREIKVVNFEGFLIKHDDAIELKRLRKKLRAQNVSKEKIKALLKLERRKAEKSLAREKKSVCFHCRKFGHNFTDCPDIKDSDLSKSGMCFKCGSMEHSHYDCKVLQSQNFRYAVCFVCKEQGHIARQCKMNPHGQYPKGGSCHFCGEITHLRKDCPKVENEKASTNVVTVEKLSHNLVEDLNAADQVLPKSVKKRKTKHVTF